ncbi:MAG: amidohydrolase [Chloroflexota bacterium]
MSLSADLIIINAKVYTVDPDNPHAEAVATKGNEIIFVGTSDEASALKGLDTQVIDGQGRTLLPGLIDSHFHLMFGSMGLGGVQLYGIETIEGLEQAIKAWEVENPESAWIVGHGTSYAVPSDEEPLTRHHLDAIEAEKPLVLVSFDVHTAWVNTAALRAADLLEGTDPLPGSAEVVMGADGLATGELIEPAAYELLLAHIPDEGEERRIALLKEGLALSASLGITSIHNMEGDVEQATLYAALEDMGDLSLRIYIPYSVTPETPFEALAAEAVSMQQQFNSDMMRSGCVKFFMDGVFESYTAMVLDGYPDQPENYGDPIFSAEHFTKMAIEADRLGLQIFVHACGDAGVRAVLDGYEAAQKENGARDSRHRVEHIELVHLDDVPRFAQLGVIASMQPLHSPIFENDPDIWPKRVRKQDWDRAFAWRTLREAGASLAFGSDWPVVTLNPFIGLYAAVNRKPWEPGYNPHIQTLEEAIAGYTRDAAYAEFQEDKKGQLKVGLWADLVLLSEDIFTIPTEQIKDLQAVVTICDGRIVYQREESDV